MNPAPAAKPAPVPTAKRVCPADIDIRTSQQKKGHPGRFLEQSYSGFASSGVVGVVIVVVLVELVVTMLVLAAVVVDMLIRVLVVAVERTTVDT